METLYKIKPLEWKKEISYYKTEYHVAGNNYEYSIVYMDSGWNVYIPDTPYKNVATLEAWKFMCKQHYENQLKEMLIEAEVISIIP